MTETPVIEFPSIPHSPPVQIAQALAPLHGLDQEDLQRYADDIQTGDIFFNFPHQRRPEYVF